MKVKFLFMDVDGTLTDGKIYMGPKGEVFKVFSIKDGYGISQLMCDYGVTPVVITGRESEIVKNRCDELGIEYFFQNVKNKINVIKGFERLSSPNTFAYIGDDSNDMPAMEYVKQAGGFLACPNDAIQEVKIIANYVCKKFGGSGAVREFIDFLIDNKMV